MTIQSIDELEAHWEAQRRSWNPIRRFIYDRASMFGYNGWYWLTHPHRLPGTAVRHMWNTIRMWVQRARRGYSYSDVWSFDRYLIQIIVGGVTDLRETQHGHPMDLTSEEWDDILTIIIEGFETRQKMLDEMWTSISDNAQKKMDESMKLFCQRFHDLWD